MDLGSLLGIYHLQGDRSFTLNHPTYLVKPIGGICFMNQV